MVYDGELGAVLGRHFTTFARGPTSRGVAGIVRVNGRSWHDYLDNSALFAHSLGQRFALHANILEGEAAALPQVVFSHCPVAVYDEHPDAVADR